MPFSFSHRKATQALNFFAREAGGTINKMKALKLVFLADRYHLRKYGRPITNDEYFALEYGPVASGAKDLAEMSDFLGADERSYARRFIRPAKTELTYSSVAEIDEKVLSESDREALDYAWQKFGRVEKYRLSKVTHRYPEWKRHEAALASKVVSRVPMSYEDFLLDPEAGTDPCFKLSDQVRQDRRSLLAELEAFEARWR
jgi:uncharacterized phage-associated protein